MIRKSIDYFFTFLQWSSIRSTRFWQPAFPLHFQNPFLIFRLSSADDRKLSCNEYTSVAMFFSDFYCYSENIPGYQSALRFSWYHSGKVCAMSLVYRSIVLQDIIIWKSPSRTPRWLWNTLMLSEKLSEIRTKQL